MSKSQFSKILDIPPLSFFQFGNAYSGSHGTLSFKITPNDDLKVQIWHSRLCSDKAEIEEEQHYPMTEDGLHETADWLESKL